MPEPITAAELAALRAAATDGIVSISELIDTLTAEVQRLTAACTKSDHAVEQTLGQVLGYPWYKDDQANFPEATEADGVCVGEHVPETLAAEAANEIKKLAAEVQRLHHLIEYAKHSIRSTILDVASRIGVAATPGWVRGELERIANGPNLRPIS